MCAVFQCWRHVNGAAGALIKTSAVRTNQKTRSTCLRECHASKATVMNTWVEKTWTISDIYTFMDESLTVIIYIISEMG